MCTEKACVSSSSNEEISRSSSDVEISSAQELYCEFNNEIYAIDEEFYADDNCGRGFDCVEERALGCEYESDVMAKQCVPNCDLNQESKDYICERGAYFKK